MIRPLLFALLTILLAAASIADGNRTSVILAIGTPGEEKYEESFSKWAADWEKAATQADATLHTIGRAELDAGTTDRDLLRKALEQEPKDSANELWVVLLGHGTFDRRDAKFNLRGPDVTAAEFAEWLAPFSRPLVIVCGFSTSGAWLKPLAAQGRIIVTATRSGSENNYSRFGGYFSESIASPAADFDGDGQTSVLEAFVAASRKVEEYYKSDDRLATEHALLEDNGDALGTPAGFFRGGRAVKKARDNSEPDGRRAHQTYFVRSKAERALTAEQRAARDELETTLEALRQRKASTPEDEYYRELEAILLELARLYDSGS